MTPLPQTYRIAPGPHRVTLTLLPQPETYFTVAGDPTWVQRFSCGGVGRGAGKPLPFTLHSPAGMVAVQAEMVYEAPVTRPEWRAPAWCHLYLKPGGTDWLWRGAAIAGDNATILTNGAGPHGDATIAFRRPSLPNAAKGPRQYPCLDGFRVSLLDHSFAGNMIFRGNQPLAPAPTNQLVDFDALHETLKLTYFTETGRSDFPEKGFYVLRDIALLDGAAEKEMLLRELLSFGGADIRADLGNRAWHPAMPATMCASGIKGQMSHWEIPSNALSDLDSQRMVRDMAALLRNRINRRESLPHIYYVHCADGAERTDLVTVCYLLAHQETPGLGPSASDAPWTFADWRPTRGRTAMT